MGLQLQHFPLCVCVAAPMERRVGETHKAFPVRTLIVQSRKSWLRIAVVRHCS